MPLKRAYEHKSIVLQVGDAVAVDFAPDSLVYVERNREDFVISNGVRNKINDLSGFIRFTLLESSPTNRILRNYQKADQDYNSGLFSMTLKDRSNNILHNVEGAWVDDSRGYPEAGAKSGERIWTLQTGSIENA